MEEGAPKLGLDTEGTAEYPWCLSYSTEPGTGYVVRRKERLTEFFAQVRKTRPLLILHNAIWDFSPLRTMGLDIPLEGLPWTDTMVKAFLIGLLPQGLKALAKRLCGMEMHSYADLMEPVQHDLTWQYLSALLERAPWKWKITRLKTKTKFERRKSEVRKAVERCLKSDNMVKLWAKQKPSIHRRARKVMGQLAPVATLDDAPLDRVIYYSARDADATLRVNEVLDQQIDEMDLRGVLDADLACLPMVERMQNVGLLVDPEKMLAMSPVLEAERERHIDQIEELTGCRINPSAPEDVSALLFDRLGLNPVRFTKRGHKPSTDAKSLGALKEQHPCIEHIIEAKRLRKMKSTYVDKLPLLLDNDNRLHPHFKITRTATGRLAEPVVLLIPKHSEIGKQIRGCFPAPPGCVLGSWDLSQIELRVLAHYSEDPGMMEAFRTGFDIHADTAHRIFGCPRDKSQQDGSKHRLPAKTINFGIVMGITAHGLREQLHKLGQTQWTEPECDDLIAAWFDAYPRALDYIERKHREAMDQGYVRDLWGRIAYLPQVHSQDEREVERALRQAQAIPIQAGANGLVKRWMARVWQDILLPCYRVGLHVEPWVQIHDDLVFEIERGWFRAVGEQIELAIPQLLKVPVTCEGKEGENWRVISS